MFEHIYIITYDIRDPKRWRKVFKKMHGYGEWLQLSVFQCRLTSKRHAELIAAVDEIIKHDEDHVLLLDLGPAESVEPRISSLGKVFNPVVKEAKIV